MSVECVRALNEQMGEIGIDFPRAYRVRMRQCVCRTSANARRVEFRTQGFHARFDIPKAFFIDKLGKGQAEKLTPSG